MSLESIRLVPLSSIKVSSPRRRASDVSQLVESIREHGLLNPITLTQDLSLIAGQHRIAAFQELGLSEIPARILDVPALRAELATIDENLVRVELTALERAEHLYRRKQIYEALHPDTKRGGDRGNQYTGGKKRQTAVSAFSHRASAQIGKSGRTIRHYIQIARKLTTEAKTRVQGTLLEDNSEVLVQIARLPVQHQLPVAEILIQDRTRTVREAKIVVGRKQLLQSSGGRALDDSDCQLVCGDFRQLGKTIDENSVDLIVTDPPYVSGQLSIFADLSAFAGRVLKPGGSLFCMAGTYYLPEIISALSQHLSYHWLIPFLLAGNGSLIRTRRVVAGHKPVLWFVKGRYEGRTFGDVVVGIGKDKRFHHWGQSESGFDLLIDRYSKAGDLVVDPFVGGGTTAAVAWKAGRRFVGFDIDENAIKMTRLRVSNLFSSNQNDPQTPELADGALAPSHISPV